MSTKTKKHPSFENFIIKVTLPKKKEEPILESKPENSSTFVVPTCFTKLTQRYVERQKRNTRVKGRAFLDDKMGGSTSGTLMRKYIYPNYEKENHFLKVLTLHISYE